MATSKIENTRIKHIEIPAEIHSGAAGSGVYTDIISPSRVINIMCRFDNANSINHPIFITYATNHATRLGYIGYINKSDVSQTETRTYTLDVFYV